MRVHCEYEDTRRLSFIRLDSDYAPRLAFFSRRPAEMIARMRFIWINELDPVVGPKVADPICANLPSFLPLAITGISIKR
jgi:hypothetical protein